MSVRMSVRIVLIALVVGCFPSVPACAQTTERADSADAALHAGRYEDARRLYRAILPQDATVAEGYARSFEATGEYEAGLADDLLSGSDPIVRCARGRLLAAVGRYAEAEAALTSALRQSGDLYRCAPLLAEIWDRNGRSREARSIYLTLYERHQQGLFRAAPDVAAAAKAAAALEQFRDANEAYRTAHEVDPNDVDVLFAWAELFRAKFNDADARRTYEEALELNPRHAPSLVGLALATPGFERQEELAQSALAVNPNYIPALDLLASLRILDGMDGEAETLAQRALAVNPASAGSLGQLASAFFLTGDEAAFAGAERQALEADARGSEFYLAVIENLNHRFRYPDAAAVAERAAAANPTDARVRAAYGSALLRLGRRDDARRHLEAAYERDPFNLFAANMLTLLDTYDGFAVLESPHVRLLLHEDESEVLGPLMLETAEAAFDDLSRRYEYAPAGKILIEAYNDPADFAVRISGVPHQGLLGVSFGDVVAVNTPAAQAGDEYNWARTLWHELAHTMAIGVSRHHVPRWFTEGLALYEEQRARPEWGRELEPAFLAALSEDRLHRLDEMDRGFTRPAYPGQVMLSYYHAGQVIAYVVDAFGFDAIVTILRELGEGSSMSEAVQTATGSSLAEIDRRFRAETGARRDAVAQALGGLPSPGSGESAAGASAGGGAEGGSLPEAYFGRLREGFQALERGDHAAAEAAFEDALSRYPAYVGASNAYEGLAAVHRERGDSAALAEVLSRYLEVEEHAVAPALELAALQQEAGDFGAAAATLGRTLHVAPYDAAVRAQLADLYERQRRFDEAVLHRRAVLALEPPDLAGAYFRLARSLSGAGRAAESRRAVLQSLEIAPDYRDAQRLLLEIAQER